MSIPSVRHLRTGSYTNFMTTLLSVFRVYPINAYRMDPITIALLAFMAFCLIMYGIAVLLSIYNPPKPKSETVSFNDFIKALQEEFPATDETVAKDLRHMQRIQDAYRDRPVPYIPGLTYKELFWLEDTAEKFSLYEWIAAKFKEEHGLKTRARPILVEIQDLYFDKIMLAKDTIGKPRPIKWSKRLGIPIEAAQVASATSPSLPSGHAVQGFLFGCLYYRENRDFFDKNPVQRKELAKYCSDHGLCRIVGGVHFVDDVRAALAMTRHVMKGKEVEPVLDLYKQMLDSI